MPAPNYANEEFHRFWRKAQGGVDHSFAYDHPGWDGSGVNVAVIDTGFYDHEDLQKIPIVAGEENIDDASHHGTMVAGIIGAKDDQAGFLGIAPRVTLLGAIARADRALESHKVIRAVANLLNPGDIFVMSLQRSGPFFADGSGELGKLGAIPFEWWEEDFQAVRYATERGIIFVTSAGNGDSNLLDARLDTPYAGAPAHWTNPFKRSGTRDSGSIIVGAASPGAPRGTNWGTLASRLGYSNYGACVDASSWGREVTTLGWFNPPNRPGNWYFRGDGHVGQRAHRRRGAGKCLGGA